jgi:hypothetical protein
LPGGAIQLTDAARILIAGNNISASAGSKAIVMLGSSDNWQIAGNHFIGGGAGAELVGVGSLVVNNFGYNPVGQISNPWPAAGGDLTNTGAGNAAPASGAVYRIRHTPKTIVVSGGDVSQILVNGAAIGTQIGICKLGVDETIAISYGSAAPDTLVFAE